MVETKAKLVSICPFFIISDLDQTVAFYTEKLGFEVRFIGPEDDPYIALLGRDNVEILVKAITEEVQPIPNPSRHGWARWDAFVYTPEPETLEAEYKSKGCEFETPLQVNSDNLLGFELKDPNGYVLYFGRTVTS